MARTLDGITVLDLSTGPAAALATMFLCDHGARVVRVLEPAASPHRAGGYVVWDRGKECVALDLADAALDAPASPYRRLVAGADVLVDDFAPGSPRQRLIDPEWLAGVNPRLVHCSITAYGKRGPLKDEPPIEDLVLARMGVLGGMPGFRPAPVHIVHPLPTVGAALFADLGIAAALLAREKTGRGRSVETSLMAGALLFHPKVTGEHIERHVFQTHPSGSAPFYSVYECADGNYLQLGCVHIGFIAIAAKLMGIGDYVAQDRFDGGRGGADPDDVTELRAKLTAVMAAKPASRWAEIFEAADVPFAPTRLTEEGMDDPQIAHNEMAISLDDPALGAVRQMGVPIHFSATPGRVQGPRAAAAMSGRPRTIRPPPPMRRRCRPNRTRRRSTAFGFSRSPILSPDRPAAGCSPISAPTSSRSSRLAEISPGRLGGPISTTSISRSAPYPLTRVATRAARSCSGSPPRRTP